jgi:hypothetical protein
MAGNELRNVTPKGGAGITGGAALLNPVAATGAALLATTQDAGRGSTVVEEGSVEDIIRNGGAIMQAEEAKKNMFADQKARLAEQIASGPDKTTTQESGGNQRSPMDRQMVADVTAGAPKAIPVAEPIDNNTALALFNNTHGSAFDPKSSMDKKKMAAITSLMSKAGSDKLTPNQFAMQIYRTTK